MIQRFWQFRIPKCLALSPKTETIVCLFVCLCVCFCFCFCLSIYLVLCVYVLYEHILDEVAIPMHEFVRRCLSITLWWKSFKIKM